MTTPAVAIVSLWRNDAERQIARRMSALALKTYANLRYIWVVGDSTDETEAILRDFAEADGRITVIRHDTGLEANTPDERLRRMGQTFNAGLDALTKDDLWLLVHESDLQSPPDIVERLMDVPGSVSAGWPMLGGQFYDTYVYRKDGVKFTNHPPYHECYKPFEPFEVDSVGSVWLAPASPFVTFDKVLRCKDGGALDIMRWFKDNGEHIFVDPQLTIIQPVDLWQSREHASV